MKADNTTLPVTFKYSKYLYCMLLTGLAASIGLVILGYVSRSILVAVMGLLGVSGMSYLLYNSFHSYCSLMHDGVEYKETKKVFIRYSDIKIIDYTTNVPALYLKDGTKVELSMFLENKNQLVALISRHVTSL